MSARSTKISARWRRSLASGKFGGTFGIVAVRRLFVLWIVPVLLLAAAGTAGALTTYQLGLGIHGGYNSRVLQPQQQAGGPVQLTDDTDAILFQVSPWVLVRTETGRITELLRYQFLFDTNILIHRPQIAPTWSYLNSIHSQTRVDLTSRLYWTLGVLGSQGRTNSFTQGDIVAPSAINALVTNFLTVGATSLLVYEPTARLQISQPINYRDYIPYDQSGIDGMAVTGAQQSHTLDGGIGVDYLFARFSLGAELRAGWFLAQSNEINAASIADRSIITMQLLARSKFQLSQRWTGEAHVGVFAATLASHFLEPSYPVPDPANPMNSVPQSATLISPIGGLGLSYLLPALESLLTLTYQHSAAGEVFLGRLTLSDAVYLRVQTPLPRSLSLALSAGFRHSELTGNGGLDNGLVAGNGVLFGQTYDFILCDAILNWQARDNVLIFLRYAYQNQIPHGIPFPNEPALLSFDRHLATVGVALFYPSK